MNVEGLLVAAFNADSLLSDMGVQAYMEVPAERDLLGFDNVPAEDNVPGPENEPSFRSASFITVERVGGPHRDVRDLPLVAIGAWAGTRWAASELAAQVAAITKRLALTHPSVARVDITSIYNNPDPASEHPRYQVNAQIVTV